MQRTRWRRDRLDEMKIKDTVRNQRGENKVIEKIWKWKGGCK
jgi:hypothetical protein